MTVLSDGIFPLFCQWIDCLLSLFLQYPQLCFDRFPLTSIPYEARVILCILILVLLFFLCSSFFVTLVAVTDGIKTSYNSLTTGISNVCSIYLPWSFVIIETRSLFLKKRRLHHQKNHHLILLEMFKVPSQAMVSLLFVKYFVCISC